MTVSRGRVSVPTAIDEFLLSCRIDGLSEPTIRYYTSILKPVATKLRSTRLDRVTPSDVRRYLSELQGRKTRYQDSPQRDTIPGGLSAESVRAHVRGLRRFFHWAEQEYGITNPMTGIRLSPRRRGEPKAITMDDLARLMDVTGNDQMGLRDRAILAFLADTGCRAGGLITLTPDHLNIDAGQALLTEKGEKMRPVPFTRQTGALLQRWMNVRPVEATTVFCGLSNTHYGRPLAHAGLYQILERLKIKAGVKGRVNPHSFRHAYAREMLKNGCDLASLSQLMGHGSVQVTEMFYAVFTPQELAARHEQFSPLRNLERRA